MNRGRCSLTLIDWIKLLFISSQYQIQNVFNSLCLLFLLWHFPSLLLDKRMASEGVWCGEGKGRIALCMEKEGNDRETVTQKPDDRGKWGISVSEWKMAKMFFSEWFSIQCWAPRPYTGNKLLIRRPVVLLKIHLHWPRANSIEITGNVSCGF